MNSTIFGIGRILSFLGGILTVIIGVLAAINWLGVEIQFQFIEMGLTTSAIISDILASFVITILAGVIILFLALKADDQPSNSTNRLIIGIVIVLLGLLGGFNAGALFAILGGIFIALSDYLN